MSYSIWGAFAETPWWIYMIFIWFLFVSWQATKPQTVKAKALIALPISLLIILYLLLPLLISLDLHSISLLIMFIFPGLAIGCLQFYFRGIKAIKNTSAFYIPGSWSIFIFLIAALILKFYYIEYPINFTFSILNEKNHPDILMMLIGLMTGVFIARTWCLYRCLKAGPYK